MANYGFNGSTVTLTLEDSSTVTLGPLRSLGFRESGARAPVHGSSDTETKYEIGVPDPEVTVSFVGGLPTTGTEIGTKIDLSIAWYDGTTKGSLTNAIIADRQTDGQMDGEITSQLTLVPNPA